MNTFGVIDWGTSNFRAYLCNLDGDVLDEVQSTEGMGTLTGVQAYRDVLHKHCKAWKHTHTKMRFFLSGMVGSKEGLQLAPQLQTPVTLCDLAKHLSRVDDDFFIVPGAKRGFANALYPDVMRGEEIQAFGALHIKSNTNTNEAIVCLPGTHSKWVRLQDAAIVDFKTYMTGELFKALSEHTIIHKTFEVSDIDCNAQAFERGLELGKSDVVFSHGAFLARSLHLKGKLDTKDTGSFLSGYLIAQEFKDATKCFDATKILVVGSNHLVGLYEKVAKSFAMEIDFIAAKQANIAGVKALLSHL